MRVTDSMIFSRASAAAATSRERAQEASDEVSTGARVVHPGDDPVAAGLIVRHRVSQAREEAIITATGRASDEITSADSALESFGNILSRSREIAMQFANSTYSADQRATAAKEVTSLFDQAVQVLNTQVDGRFIFGGDHDSAPPFDATGNYLGDTAVRQVEIAPGVQQDASVRADVLAKGVGGGTDVLATITALSTALAANDQPGIQATLDNFDLSTRQVSTGRSQIGASMAVFDAAGLAARTARDAEKLSGSHEADSDTIDAASRLALAQRSLDATLSAAAQTFKLTLLDKLG